MKIKSCASYFVFAYNDEGAGSENREWYGFLFFGE